MKDLHEDEPTAGPTKYRVRDLCATRGSRVHDLMVNGRMQKVTFPENDYIELDPMTAAPLIGNDGFEVKTASGIVLRPVSDHDHGLTLRTGQVVAELHELDKAALAARCKALPGGHKFHPIKSSKSDMIDFLMRSQSAASDKDSIADEEVELEEFDDDGAE